MRLKLKENPREWQKFIGVLMVMMVMIGLLGWRRGWLGWAGFLTLTGVGVAVVAAAVVSPKWFRPIYRAGMTASFHVGQVLGQILLLLMFLLVVTPLGLILRLCGHDLLALKRNPARSSYWLRAKTNRNFDRLF